MTRVNSSPTVSIFRDQSIQQKSSLVAVFTYPRVPSVQSSKLTLRATQKGGWEKSANGKDADSNTCILGKNHGVNKGSEAASKFRAMHRGRAILRPARALLRPARYLAEKGAFVAKKGVLGVLSFVGIFAKTIDLGLCLKNRIVKKKAHQGNKSCSSQKKASTPAAPKPQENPQKRLISPSPFVEQIITPSEHSQKLTLHDVRDLPVVLHDWKKVVFGLDIASLPEGMRKSYQQQGRNIMRNKTIDKIASRPAELTDKVWDSLGGSGVSGSTYADFFRIYSSKSGEISEKTANEIAVCMLIELKRDIEELRRGEVSLGNTDELLSNALRRIGKTISNWEASVPAPPQEKQPIRLVSLSSEVKQIIIPSEYELEHSQELTLQDLNSLLIAPTDWKKAVFGVDTNSLPKDMKQFHQKQGRHILRNKTIDKISSRPAGVSEDIYEVLRKSQKALDSLDASRNGEITYADFFNLYRESGAISEETANGIAVDMLAGIKQDIEFLREEFKSGKWHSRNTDKPLTDTDKSLVDETLSRSLRHIDRTIEAWQAPLFRANNLKV